MYFIFSTPNVDFSTGDVMNGDGEFDDGPSLLFAVDTTSNITNTCSYSYTANV